MILGIYKMSEECQENLSPTGNKNFHEEINIIIDSTGNEDEKLTKYEQVSKIPEINEKQIINSSEGNVLSKETNTKKLWIIMIYLKIPL